MLAEIMTGSYLAANIVAVVFGATLGATFADIDLAPPLPLKHRSVWTHGPFVPLALLWSVGLYPIMWWFTVGFLPAFALHLLADMFPKRWHGGAKIKLYPLPGTLPALLSFLYLAAGVVFSGQQFYRMVF